MLYVRPEKRNSGPQDTVREDKPGEARETHSVSLDTADEEKVLPEWFVHPGTVDIWGWIIQCCRDCPVHCRMYLRPLHIRPQ